MKNKSLLAMLLFGTGITLLNPHFAVAERIGLNYDRLSVIEGPIAMELGDITFTLSGSMDLESVTQSNDHAPMNSLFSTVQLSFNTQLPNRWRVQGLVLGEASTASNPRRIIDDFDYVKRFALVVSGTWGSFLIGDLHRLVRRDTRRITNAGDGYLYFDDFLGKLRQKNGGYRGRYGPWVISTIFDQDGDFDWGMVSQRPLGNKDIRLTLRTMKGKFEHSSQTATYNTQGAILVGEVIYGSTIFDISLGFEELFPTASDATVLKRTFLSQGVLKKFGMP